MKCVLGYFLADLLTGDQIYNVDTSGLVESFTNIILESNNRFEKKMFCSEKVARKEELLQEQTFARINR